MLSSFSEPVIMPSTSAHRNIEKELVLSRSISWKDAKTLTDAARGSGSTHADDILEAAKNLYEKNPGAYGTVKRQILRQKSLSDLESDSDAAVTEDEEIWC
jgi:hypothetical protein